MSSFHKLSIYVLALLSVTPSSYTGPSAAPDNIVDVTSVDKFCLIVPRTAHTSIGDSEHPGGMQTYCSPHGHTDPKQDTYPLTLARRQSRVQIGNGQEWETIHSIWIDSYPATQVASTIRVVDPRDREIHKGVFALGTNTTSSSSSHEARGRVLGAATIQPTVLQTKTLRDARAS
ncbi:hypothetical protein BDZ89DRAFT_1111232 [Hymenopellis radicata]|nr:hypothetical protein BDZ89DRAFT_1111232 [Hymenopellis radicata]